jgi:protein SCO1/2
MKKAGILKKILILVIVLALPGFLYYLLVVEGRNRYIPLPVFGPKALAKTTHRVGGKDVPDTLYHTLPDFQLTDQHGEPVSLKSFDKKIFVANFFYTRCPTVCRRMNENMNQLAASYTKNKMVYFVSITVDPQHDSAEALKSYADSFKPLSPKWMFLTGDTSTIYNLARNGFLVNALQPGPDDFYYSDKLILIDQDKRIRGYYSGAATDEVSRLNDEIKVLVSEELLKNDVPEY